MEADWEVEVGGDARVIEPDWPGFVDLRRVPKAAAQLSEAGQLPGLDSALMRLNAPSSPVWTSKCDVWPLAEFDPDELDVPRESARAGIACYVDLLPRGTMAWATPGVAAGWCRQLCTQLHAIPLLGCRIDLVVRAAHFTDGRTGHAVTAYISAAGPDSTQARHTLSSALAAFADSVAPIPPRAPVPSKLE